MALWHWKNNPLVALATNLVHVSRELVSEIVAFLYFYIRCAMDLVCRARSARTTASTSTATTADTATASYSSITTAGPMSRLAKLGDKTGMTHDEGAMCVGAAICREPTSWVVHTLAWIDLLSCGITCLRCGSRCGGSNLNIKE